MSILHLQKIMAAQDYILTKLSELNTFANTTEKVINEEDLASEIYKIVMSKKFRKYSVAPETADHIQNAIKLNIEKNEPINFTLQHGAFKLWRLEVSPDVDWAELFTLMHYTNWVKTICKIYPPGVWFDFYVHDQIIPILNNIEDEDKDFYLEGYQSVVKFLRQYQPNNLNMTISPVSNHFDSEEDFKRRLEQSKNDLTKKTKNRLPKLTDTENKILDMNVKPTQEQWKDPKWREKVWHLHDAYLVIQDEIGYRENQPQKILISNRPEEKGNTIAIGTTKSSVMKFWLGTGGLLRKDTSYKEVIYSPSQLEKTSYEWENIKIPGLERTNFSEIKVFR